jgi:branched-chain amino acid transport system ATP-binding protein
MKLSVRGLTKRFASLTVLDNVNIELGEQERRAVIGPNGAGKTTLFNLLSGQLSPTSGSIALGGQSLTDLPTYQRTRLGLARTFQRNNLFRGLSVFENVRLSVQAHSNSAWDIFGRITRHTSVLDKADEIMVRINLASLARRRADELSYGDQRRVEIAIALASSPHVLLVDEPTAGMSTAETVAIVDLLGGLERSISLLIVEHDMEVVSALTDRVTVLQNGCLLADGTWDEIRSNQLVQESYLRRKGGYSHA